MDGRALPHLSYREMKNFSCSIDLGMSTEKHTIFLVLTLHVEIMWSVSTYVLLISMVGIAWSSLMIYCLCHDFCPICQEQDDDVEAGNRAGKAKSVSSFGVSTLEPRPYTR